MTDAYALWRAELAEPTPESDRHTRIDDPSLICGFWRVAGARTKVSYPCAIWPQDGSEGNAIFFKVGVGAKDGASLFSTVANPDRVDEFRQSTWLKCTAVTEDAYHSAMASGYWADGQQARQMSEAEKLDLIPTTPASEGGNMPEGEDSFHAQVVEKITTQLDKIKELKWPFKTLDDANAAAAIVEALRGLGKQGEAKRKEEKQPWIDGANAVDAKWSLLKEASSSIQTLVSAIDSFRRAEEARLRRERDEADRLERERLRKEAEEQALREAEQARRDALAKGEDFHEPTPEAIAEQVAAQVEEQIAAAPPKPEPTVRVGTERGRAITKAKVASATITDAKALAIHLVEAGDADLMEYLQKRANAAARAKITLPGMEIDK